MQAIPLHKKAEIRVASECCILFENRILLQKRPDDARNFPGFWTFPGGHVDWGEDAMTAIIREIAEETGVKLKSKEVKLKVSALNYHVDRDQIWIIFGYAAKLKKFQECISTEEGECKWFDLDEVSDLNLFPPIRHYLEFVASGKPGILHMSGEWEDSKLKKLTSEITDASN